MAITIVKKLPGVSEVDQIKELVSYNNQYQRQDVVSIKMRHGVYYIAASLIDKETQEVTVRCIIATTMSAVRMCIGVNLFLEDDIPPPRHISPPQEILDALTPSDKPWVNEWRRCCKAKADREPRSSWAFDESTLPSWAKVQPRKGRVG